MATQRQIEANRRNAQRSTGPVTELGKGVAKFNALKHGMTASTAVLPHEDPSSYAELRESFVATYKPANAVEASLVEVVANSYWRLLRARRVETSAFDLEIRGLKQRNKKNTAPHPGDDKTLAVVIVTKEETVLNLERHQTKIERSYFQAIETLRKVQKERLREERLTTAAPNRIGFVSQTGSHIASVPRPSFEITETPDLRIVHIARPCDPDATRATYSSELQNTL